MSFVDSLTASAQEPKRGLCTLAQHTKMDFITACSLSMSMLTEVWHNTCSVGYSLCVDGMVNG
eukprot:4730398-Amphidinium_carterae.1